ncbi:MAG: hypothetical protein H0X38_14345 [Planctomycetes bacterium]|nr:hypothetical protein [Planctomycetota bacterium]
MTHSSDESFTATPRLSPGAESADPDLGTRRLTRILRRAGALPCLERHLDGGRCTQVRWTPEHEAYLGLASDGQLARLWNVPIPCVYWRRRRLALPPYGASSAGITWTAAMLRELATLSDHQFAQRHGMAASTAAHKRRACRIPAATRWNTVQWTVPMLRQLGKVPDLEIARIHGLAPMTVTTKRHELGIPRLIRTKVDWMSPRVRALLGTMPDNDVATQLGVNAETVRLQRALAGIPRFRHDLWTPAIIARLGGEPDRAIADEVGISTDAVAWQRRRRGIASWSQQRQQRAEPCVAAG